MKNNSKKKKGFTLLEIVISLCVIAIVSVSAYSGFTLMIKVIKSGEEKQKTALTGKQTIEKIKSATERKSLDASKGTVDLGNIIFEVNKNGDDINFKNKVIYLDSNYEVLPSDVNAKYKEFVELKKAQATDDHDSNKKINIELDNKIDNTKKDDKEDGESKPDKLKEKEDNIIKCKFGLVREKDSNDVTIKYFDEKNENKKYVVMSNVSKDKLSINVYIEDDGNKKKVTIKNNKGDSIEVKPEKEMKNEYNNKLEVYLNFNQYNKSEDEKPIEVKVFNKEDSTNSSTATVICEKSKDIEVNVKPAEGEIFFGDNRSDSSETKELGTLYNIDVKISKINDNEVLFQGYSNQNIVISK